MEALVVRSRDPRVIAESNVRIDVGGVYNPETLDFDHHMQGGAGRRANGVPYAAFGLVWKHFGLRIAQDTRIAEEIERHMVIPIDAADNRYTLVRYKAGEIRPYSISSAVATFKPSDWDIALAFARANISGAIFRAKEEIRGEEVVKRAVEKHLSPQVLLLDDSCRWDHYVSRNFPEIVLVVYPKRVGWLVQTVKRWHRATDTTSPRLLPREWAGMRGLELQEITGVGDAVFCHQNRYLIVAESREGALRLAELALLPGEVPVDSAQLEENESRDAAEANALAAEIQAVLDTV
jgi:uncharacterized UPF0160 family protein